MKISIYENYLKIHEAIFSERTIEKNIIYKMYNLNDDIFEVNDLIESSFNFNGFKSINNILIDEDLCM